MLNQVVEELVLGRFGASYGLVEMWAPRHWAVVTTAVVLVLIRSAELTRAIK